MQPEFSQWGDASDDDRRRDDYDRHYWSRDYRRAQVPQQQQQQQQEEEEEGIEWAAENVAEVEEKEEELWVDPSDGNAYSLAVEDHAVILDRNSTRRRAGV